MTTQLTPHRTGSGESALSTLYDKALEECRDIQAVIDSGQWPKAIETVAQAAALKLGLRLMDKANDLEPGQLAATIKSMYEIAKTQMGEASNLTANVSLRADLEDMSPREILAIITKQAPPQPHPNNTTTTSIETKPLKTIETTNSTPTTTKAPLQTALQTAPQASKTHSIDSLPPGPEIIDCRPPGHTKASKAP